jgi:hypothetical protein
MFPSLIRKLSLVRPEDMQCLLPHRLLKVVILSGNPISDNERCRRRSIQYSESYRPTNRPYSMQTPEMPKAVSNSAMTAGGGNVMPPVAVRQAVRLLWCSLAIATVTMLINETVRHAAVYLTFSRSARPWYRKFRT